MSFLKDPDAYTRGSGAIASSDYRNPRRAAERRARLARSAAVDQRRAQLTYGARGGMGAIDANRFGAGGARRPVIQQGGNIESPPIGPTGGPQVGSGKTGFVPRPPGGGRMTPVNGGRTPSPGGLLSTLVTSLLPGGGAGGVGTPGTNTQPFPGTVTVTGGGKTVTGGGGPRRPLVGPTKGTTVLTFPAPTSTTSGSTSPASTVSGGGVRINTAPGPQTQVCWDGTVQPAGVPCAGEATVYPVTAPPSKKPPWLLIAAVVGGAYLLYRHEKKGGE